MKFRAVTRLACLALPCLALTACTHSGPSTAGAGDTLMAISTQAAAGGVGVVRRTELLVAYHKSPRFKAQLDALIAERDAARAAGDQALVDRLEAYGAEMQEVAHRQLAGREPLYTTLLGVEPELRAIMEARGLCRVLEAGPGAEGIDITDELVAALSAQPTPQPAPQPEG